MDRKRIKAALLAALMTLFLAAPLAGCSSKPEEGVSQSSASSQGTDLFEEYYIDPSAMDKVLEEIYEEVPDLLMESISEPTEEEIEEVLKLTPSKIGRAHV